MDSNGSFKVGDLVNYNVGSNVYPGIVVKVTRKSVTIRDIMVTKWSRGFGRHGLEFDETQQGSESKFTQRKTGDWVMMPGQLGRLLHGAVAHEDSGFYSF